MFPEGAEGDCGQGAVPGSTPGGSTDPPALRRRVLHHKACQHHRLGETTSPQGCAARPCAQLLHRASLRGLGGWLACAPPHQIISPSSSSIPELRTPKSLIQLRSESYKVLSQVQLGEQTWDIFSGS